MAIQHPHDNFFRKSLGRTEMARNYLEEYLPPEIRQLLNLDHLVLQNPAFVDDEIHPHQGDLLYETKLITGQPAYIYFLFEHKSSVDYRVSFQLLRYIVHFWERQDEEQQPLSAIIPLVIYHGERQWHVPRNFLALLDVPEILRPYLPDFQYHLSDFSHLSEETIRGEIWLRVFLSVLRAIHDPRLREELP